MPPAQYPDHRTIPAAPPNRLVREKSPYLLQHAYNSVNWYPWGEEAFSRAGREDKPVFLSIGYATCHWCHVMAHESFEDPGIAAILNRDFVCIKVDREERPDIDSVYMGVCQMMTGQGGWPLTIIMTPEKKPFFAGTYFPPETRFGMNGLPAVLARITRLWKEQREALLASANEISDAVVLQQDFHSFGDADASFITAGYNALTAVFDPVNGGFGRAPKFPSPPTLLFLLRYYARTKDRNALRMAEQTLDAMRGSGIYDHVGGGFHRYSVDQNWRIPHFEKMLYDQALLCMTYTEAALLTGNKSWRRTAEEIITYILRDLTCPEGAFITAEDADSPGGEGVFYLWKNDEIEAVLGKPDALFAMQVFAISPYEDRIPPGQDSGAGVLYCPGKPEKQACAKGIPEQEFARRFESVRSRLFEARLKRERPSRDGKVLADGNGLCIAALAIASRASGDARYLAAADRAMDLLLTRMRMADGGLFHRYRDGEAAIPGFADDYAFVIRALLELYLSTFNPSRLSEALGLHRYFQNHFWDETSGGFFSTADNAEHLLVRKKELYDGVVPSSNSMALGNLVILSLLTGDPHYEKTASELARAFSGAVSVAPSAYTGFLSSLDLLVNPSTLVAVAGSGPEQTLPPMIRDLWGHYFPSVTILWCRNDDPALVRTREELMPVTRGLVAIGEKPAAYVCSGRRCSLPVTDTEKLLELLRGNS
ncbi:thioredoxin domain-containing protein [Methanoregula sp.]|uniref:thioredoxin domain-containing protein n=1 Tax=Methanoregula sp. TaxID=2052170 RepID=UPI0035699113